MAPLTECIGRAYQTTSLSPAPGTHTRDDAQSHTHTHTHACQRHAQYARESHTDVARVHSHAHMHIAPTRNERAVEHDSMPARFKYEEPVPLSMQDRMYSSVHYAEVDNVETASVSIDESKYVKSPVSIPARSQVVRNSVVHGVRQQYDGPDPEHSIYGSEA